MVSEIYDANDDNPVEIVIKLDGRGRNRERLGDEANLGHSVLLTLGTGAVAGTGKSVFAHPEKYLGKTVTVCGYVEDRSENRNIWVDRAHFDHGTMGMAILGSAPLTSWDGGRACLTGKVLETHCTDSDRVCLDTGYPYGVTVIDVRPAN